ncbi:hypothetical protein BASA82_000586 [Batrachochytrium salamandrivorans]|nr:hypothetical protein BASA81_003947 [Batrachochytrium salamandrivorans]KAH9262368.1 hypothetical protein BASA82_000586 [Batrachochytrium salamandrivorans]
MDCYNLSTCVCGNGYIQQSEGNRFTGCSVHLYTSIVLHAVSVGIWLGVGALSLLSLFALWFWQGEETSTANQTLKRNELGVAFGSLLVAACFVAYETLILSSPSGDRFPGQDLITSLLFFLAHFGAWCVVLSKPLLATRVPQLSSARVLQLAPRTRRIYLYLVFPWLSLALCLSLGMLGIYLTPQEDSTVLLRAMYLGAFALSVGVSLFILFALTSLKRHIAIAVQTSPNPQHRAQLAGLYRPIHAMWWIVMLTMLLFAGCLLAMGYNRHIAIQGSWVAFPVLSSLVGVSMLHTMIKIGYNIAILGPPQRQAGIREGGRQTRDYHQKLAIKSTSPTTTLTSTAPSSKRSLHHSHSRKRRLTKGQRPVAKMSVVIERTNENAESAAGQ